MYSMFLYVKQTFRITKVRISQEVKVVIMRNRTCTIFLYEDEYVAKLSDVH